MVKDGITLVINKETYTVPSSLSGTTSLNTFIRDHAHLKGTKFMCLEGGCGACVVEARYKHPVSGKYISQAVNSCLVPVFACHGWSITTIEGVGSKKKGYHEIQKRLTKNSGTQCGYCSPGMVMNMYSLMADNPNLTMAEIENSFGGNLCRCTGYRPILESFKSFAKDAPKDLIKKCIDIEDMTKICPTTGKICSGKCSSQINGNNTEMIQLDKNEFEMLEAIPKSFKYTLIDGSSWYRVSNIKEIFEILDMAEDNDYMIVGGNTAHGVYRNKPFPIYIDIGGVPELHTLNQTSNAIIFGANVSLTEAMSYLNKVSKEKDSQFAYAKALADHIDLIANVPVRNTGTLAGNLSIKHKYHEFPSDIFLILETVGAQVVIVDNIGVEQTLSLMQYLDTNMNKILMSKIILPALNNKSFVVKTYKIMPRAQNAHAYINAGFCFNFDEAKNFKVLSKPSIVIGGIHPDFVHANKTEEFLVGKELLDKTTLTSALKILNDELNPNHIPPDGSPNFRKGLAVNLFYKFVLSLSPDRVSARNRSGGSLLERQLSTANQEYDTDKEVWPVNKPISKIEGLYQCSGEAEYVNDIHSRPGELYGAFVLATKATATSFTLDASEALKIPGVVAFYTAKDIPGENTFTPKNSIVQDTEELFASEKIVFAGQALGLIVADTHAKALDAASKVKVEYKGVTKPVIDVRKLISSGDDQRIYSLQKVEPTATGNDIKYKVIGKFDLKGQYHFTMETLSCLCVPIEDGIDVFATTQWIAFAQHAVSTVLNIPINRVNMQVRRLGGAYGAKITRSNQIAAACAVASYSLKKPVRIILSLENNMEMIGKRIPCYSDYEAGVNENGKIQYLNVKLYEDDGSSKNDVVYFATIHHMTFPYESSTWKVEGFGVRTDTESNTWCRAPGSTEGIAVIENIMEHIAHVVKKDPVEVRLANMKSDESVIPQLITDIKNMSSYSDRVADIKKFNNENRWKKRGISLVPMIYPFGYWGSYHSTVSVYAPDGTVAITHGCVEIGQGLNTKVAQVCAYMFGIDVDDVSIKPTMAITSPNNTPTGGSLGSEAASYATKICCETILKRLEPIKTENPKASWKELVKIAANKNINLNASHMFTAADDVKNYAIYGTSVIEVEVDLLTGQHQILKADIIEDAGISLSPEVDIGQIEGAYIMGLGYHTNEELIRDSETGRLLTNRTWNYKIPGAKDIPIKFNVQLRKNAPNPVGVLRSKATGEPPLCMSVGILFAIRNALNSARADAGLKDEWFDLEAPYTGERIWTGASTSLKSLDL
uniref:FAD-binding PCMH-type domain-containing protein n=1 Tax=Clastoptera arizonana TaxID=38151 RepID=A0A1B6E3D0_9HEMI